MFKCFFLVILIMVESAIRFMRKGIEKGKFEASYRCLPCFNNYSIFFPEYILRLIFIIGRNYALVEEESIVHRNEFFERLRIPIETVFKITYRPSPDKVNKFESDIYRKYCDVLKSRFHGSFSEYCTVGVNSENCPILGSTIYNLYFHLITDYTYPFLSHLSEVKFHIESCTPFMIRTRNITLLSSGVFSYRDRFSFSSNVVRFDIDCDHPSKSIRRAINRIISMM